jgi:glycosyltransferase involved in cell wall biosynthesis
LTRPAATASTPPTPLVPHLTVLIASWNAESTIERALASVLEEREISLECIVVDDGSTDGTADLAAAIAEMDPRVKLIRLPVNEGVSSARNTGLAVARGEWLTFLDADDRLLPGAIAALMRPTADASIRAVLGQRIWTDGETRWISRLFDIPDIRRPGRKSIASNPGLLFFASATGKVFHRSLVSGLRFEGRILGDQPWTIRALLRAGDNIEVIGDTVYEWLRPHPDRDVLTITSAAKASASGAAEAAAMARMAFQGVSAEIDLQVPDAATRLAIKEMYFERLLRSDLRGPVRYAIERRDPDTGELYASMGRFLEVVPASVLARSKRLYVEVILPPIRNWRFLVPSARTAYWRMIRPALQAAPAVIRRIDDRRGSVLAYNIARRVPSPIGPPLATAVLLFSKRARRIRRRMRRSRATRGDAQT